MCNSKGFLHDPSITRHMNNTIWPLKINASHKLTFVTRNSRVAFQSSQRGHGVEQGQMRAWQWRTGTGNVLRGTIGISIASKFLIGESRSTALRSCMSPTDFCCAMRATRIIFKLTTWLEKSNRLREEGIFRVCGNAIPLMNH
jgi:hypothetical protein